MPEGYGTDTDFEAYVLATGRTAADPNSPDTVEAARVRASMWIDARYGARFSGKKTDGRDQERAQPRTGQIDAEGLEIDEDEVPIEVEYATYEATLLELASPGSLQPTVTPAKNIKKVSVEGAVSVEYANTGTSDQLPVITIIDGILAPLLDTNFDYSSGLFGTTFRI